MQAPSSRLWPNLRLHVAVPGVVLALLTTASCTDVPAPWNDRRPPPTRPDPPVFRTATAPSHGFNDGIAWRGLEEGLVEARTAGMPLMLVVHASWCARCKELKPKFQEAGLAELSQRFVMVNADQDLTPAVLEYTPDGQYIPRVLFFDPTTGVPDQELQNPTRTRYHYYYGPQDDLEGAMEKALARHGKS